MITETAFWLLVAVLSGLAVGSFIAVASLRLPAKKPMLLTRSACDGCGRQLRVAELIPVVSYLALKGRCATCGGRIARRHLLLELTGAVLGAWAALTHPGFMGLAGAVLAWQLLLLAVLDAEHLWLPRFLTMPLIATGLGAALPLGTEALMARLIGAAVGFLVFWALSAAYRHLRGRVGLGGGDAYMLAGAGAWVGWTLLPYVVLIAALSGLLFAVAPALRGRKIDHRRPIPFGVFLAIGTWLTWLYG